MEYRRARHAFVCGLVILAVSCGDGGTDPGPDPCPQTVVALPSTMQMDPGGVRTLTATVTDCNGPVAAPTLGYSSLDPAVASASAGTVVAEGPGTGRIVVSSGSAKDTVTVAVYTPFHPGSTSVSATLDGGPYGIGTSGTGQVYATRLLDAKLGRDTLPIAGPITNTIDVGQDPTDVVFVPRLNKAFVTNQGSSNVGIIDATTHTQTGVIPTGGNPFRILSAFNDRTYVTVASGQLLVLNSTTNARVDSVTIDPAANGLTLSADNSTAYVSSTGTGRVQVIDLASMTVVDSMFVGGIPQDIALSGDEATLYVANEGVGLMKLDLASRTVIDTLLIPAFGVKITPDGTMLVVVGGGDVTLVDEATFTAGPVITVGGEMRRLAFARGGRIAVVANGGNSSIVTIQ